MYDTILDTHVSTGYVWSERETPRVSLIDPELLRPILTVGAFTDVDPTLEKGLGKESMSDPFVGKVT